MIFLALWIHLQSLAAWELTGQATTLDGKTPLYTEHHRIEFDDKGLNKKIESLYKKEGQVFAKLKSTFNNHPLVPEMEFSDSRFGLRQELRWIDNKQLRFRTERDGKPAEEKIHAATEDAVAGQGFDNFIKTHFEKLQKSTMPLRYGVLEEMDLFSFTGGPRTSKNPERVRFGIHLRNPLLRLFVEELEVEYDAVTRRIQTYRGLSNLLDEKGKAQNVLIHYTWKELKGEI